MSTDLRSAATRAVRPRSRTRRRVRGDPRTALSSAPTRADVTRRRFLQGMLASAGTIALVDRAFGRAAAAVAPLGAAEGVLVMLQLGGGNDGLNTVVPVLDPTYATLRSHLSVASGSHPLGASGFALHPALAGLAARYAAGKVAIVNGVGNPAKDLSHFSSMASWMAGTAGAGRPPDGSAGSSTRFPTARRGCGRHRSARPHRCTCVGARSPAVAIGGPRPAVRLVHRRGLGAADLPERGGNRRLLPPGSARSPTRSARLETRMITNGKHVVPAALGPHAPRRRPRAEPRHRRPADQPQPRRPRDLGVHEGQLRHPRRTAPRPPQPPRRPRCRDHPLLPGARPDVRRPRDADDVLRVRSAGQGERIGRHRPRDRGADAA